MDGLNKDERILYQTSISKLAYLNAFFAFALSMFPTKLAKLAGTRLTLTNQRIFGKSGMGRRNFSLAHAQNSGITVQQGILGHMFDYGTVCIYAKNGDKSVFKGVTMPLIFQQEAEQAVERAVLGKTLDEFVTPVYPT